MNDQQNGPEAIAVVGMALRVPGASTLDQFWHNILQGYDSLTRPSIEELRLAGVSRRQLADPQFVRSGPILRDIDRFDAAFFGMTEFEAERTDPGHRLFLECAWEAMEAAGIVPGRGGPVAGVFAGGEGRYRTEQLSHLDDRRTNLAVIVEDRGKTQPLNIGNSLDYFPARVSYKLDLTGPSFDILAACATSLIALHLAVKSLRRRECDVAVVGGGSILYPQVGGYLASVEGLYSSSGQVKPFDADADGTIFGSGVGAIVIRPLRDALADGNPIWSIVRGSGMSNDGNPEGKRSFIAPSREGQTAAVAAALADAQVPAESIGYLEAHGTATRLGDPVEVASVTEVYRRETSATGYCALGSVKANVGHLRMAAGVISTIKACLALKNRTLPPLANFTRLNPRIELETSPFFVSDAALEWSEGATPRRAAISSFGFGGMNAHAIVEEYVSAPAPASSRPYHLVPLSAKSAPSLERRFSDLASHLDANPDICLADVAHTLQNGRLAMPHRAFAILKEGATDLATQLWRESKPASLAKSPSRPVVFLFPGQGAQRPSMGEDVYRREPVYRETIDRCAEALEPELGLDIRTLIHAEPGSTSGGEMLRQTANAQPALFAVGYGLARQFMSWGVSPEAMLGHSIGEIVAACVAEVLSLDDALTLVAARARLMQAQERGAMAAVFLPEEKLNGVLGDALEIAAVNAPNICVVSGSEPDVAAFLAKMEEEGVGTRRVDTSHAFHSRMMDPALPAFREVLHSIQLNAPKIPVISNETGSPLTEGQATDPEYWAHHLRQTVRFSSGAQKLLENAERVFLELGPSRTLCDLMRRHDSEASAIAALECGDTESDAEAPSSAMQALGQLWCAGGDVDWQDFYADEARQKAILPTYPFERQRYWLEPGELETKRKEDLFLYESSWRLAEPEQLASEDDGRLWLVFRDEHGIGAAVAEALEAQGRPVLCLIPGDTLAEVGRNTFSVRPGSKDDLAAVLSQARIRDSGLSPVALHLWSLTGPTGEHNTIEAFREANRTGFNTLIALTQAAYEIGMTDGMDVLVVADGLRQIEGEYGPLHSEKGSLLGPVHNVSRELPSMSLRYVDISGFESRVSADELVGALLSEARAKDKHRVICLRQSGRYVEELYRFDHPPLGRPRLRDGGTVLVTGGMGGLGLKIAGALFEAAQARVVLTSRWQPPPREEWSQRALADDKVGRALRDLLALEARGAELLVVVADVGDLESLKTAVAEAEAHFGAINGVVHAAGVNVPTPAIEIDLDAAAEAFAAKVHGAFNLERVFSDAALDFFVHFSSQASYRPSPGQAVYTAANCVLDVLARRRSLMQPGLTCAIGWGPWEETGMAAVWAEQRLGVQSAPSLTDHQQSDEKPVDHPLIRSRRGVNGGSVVYSSSLRDRDHWITEHRFKGRALMAGTAILECLRASYIDFLGAETAVEFSQLGFVRPLFIPDQGVEIEIEYALIGDRHRVEVRSRPIGYREDWAVNTVGFAAPAQLSAATPTPVSIPQDIAEIDPQYTASGDFEKGHRWSCVTGIKIDGDTMWSRVSLNPDYLQDLELFGLHPAMFDRALNDPHGKPDGASRVPYAINRIRIDQRLGARFFAASFHKTAGDRSVFDSIYVDDAGNTLVEVDGFVAQEVEGSSLADSAGTAEREPTFTGLARNQRFVVTRPGIIESLALQEFTPELPGDNDVQIDVVAAGLNFRDVLSTLGQIPAKGGSARGFGGECSGIVSAVGPGVVDLRSGDPVVALVDNGFGGSVTTSADLVMPVPRRICMEDAAGIPIVFLTAAYAINTLAGLKEGERILIHAAAGGVGLAAVQLAQQIGAEIFATAGHEEKREYLRSLGVEHVMDSRSLDFVEVIGDLTNGEGIDVVLNSLAGEFIPAGLGLLRYRGRFLEIGKRDILSDSKIGLSPFQNNLAYHAIDLSPMLERCDPLLVDLFDSLMLQFARGDLSPVPTAVMPVTDIGAAMQRMARAEHIGKIVLKVRDDPDQWRSIFKPFQEHYGRGVPVRSGVEMFRRLLSSNRLPHYVLVRGRRIDEAGRAEHRVVGRATTRPNLAVEYQAPGTPEEQELVGIWESALGVAPIGVHDDFFDLGGDSITAIQTQFAVAEKFSINLSTTALLDHPTIADLAKFIRDGDPEAGEIRDRDDDERHLRIPN